MWRRPLARPRSRQGCLGAETYDPPADSEGSESPCRISKHGRGSPATAMGVPDEQRGPAATARGP